MAKRDGIKELLTILDQAARDNTGIGLQDHAAAFVKNGVNRLMGKEVDHKGKAKGKTAQGKAKRASAVNTEVTWAYKFLGLDTSASKEQVKQNYKWLASKYHPDNLKTGDEAKMKDLNKAWEILGKP